MSIWKLKDYNADEYFKKLDKEIKWRRIMFRMTKYLKLGNIKKNKNTKYKIKDRHKIIESCESKSHFMLIYGFLFIVVIIIYIVSIFN